MKVKIKKRFFSLMLVASVFFNMFTASIVSHAAGYNINAAVQFAYDNYNNNSSWQCAEFVSRCLQAGGISFNVQAGCGNFYRQLQKTPGFTEYKLAKSGQQIKSTGANSGKVAVGDVLVHVKPGSKPLYKHAMFVTKVENGIVHRTQRNKNQKDAQWCAFDSESDVICFHYTGTPYVEPKPVPTISDVTVKPSKSPVGYTVTCRVGNADALDKVEFPTWTEKDGQDDLIWHRGTNLGNGLFSFTIDISSHNNERGRYYTHIYAWNTEGKYTSNNSVSVYIPGNDEKPVVSDVEIENLTSEGFDISYKVAYSYEIDYTMAFIYHDNKLYTFKGVKSGDKYRIHYSLKDNETGAGEYTLAYIRAYNKFGDYTHYNPVITINVPEPTVNVSTVTLDKSELELKVGETASLTATVKPDNATNKKIKWTSSNEAVAIVSDGTVTAKDAGEVTIKAVSDENSTIFAECKVTVKADDSKKKADDTKKSDTVEKDDPSKKASDDKADSFTKSGKITKIKAGKKKFTITFDKVSIVDGYQVQYSTSKNFKSAKTKTVSAKKASLTVKKLKSKKTYYIRIRAYKNSSIGRIYSDWSKVKKAKIK